MPPIDYKIGQTVTIDRECMERMRSSNRSCATPGYPSDTFLERLSHYVGLSATVTHRFEPGYEMTIKYADGHSFHMKDSWVTPRMLHFTLTGAHAGFVVCGAARDNLRCDYMHSPGDSQMRKYLESNPLENVCPHCMHEFLMTWAQEGSEEPGPGFKWEENAPQWARDLLEPNFKRIKSPK